MGTKKQPYAPDQPGSISGPALDFDRKAHLKPSRENFADEADWYEFESRQDAERATALKLSSELKASIAEKMRKVTDPDAREDLTAYDRLRVKMDEVLARLKDKGVEVPE